VPLQRQCLVSVTGDQVRCARIPIKFVRQHLHEVACMGHNDEQPLDVSLVLLGQARLMWRQGSRTC
jgi:hypothetical protein